MECQLLIEEIRLPKLFIRVQRSYPLKGRSTYGFERPPLGWVGVLEEIRANFKLALANGSDICSSVAAILDVWARTAEYIIDRDLRRNPKPGLFHAQ